MSPELSAKRISDYLITGFHHNTDEAQAVIANIIRDAQECLTNNLHLASEGERYALERYNKLERQMHNC